MINPHDLFIVKFVQYETFLYSKTYLNRHLKRKEKGTSSSKDSMERVWIKKISSLEKIDEYDSLLN